MKKQNLMTMVIAMTVFFLTLSEGRAAVSYGIAIGPVSGLNVTSGLDVTSNSTIFINKADIDLAGGTYFDNWGFLFEVHDDTNSNLPSIVDFGYLLTNNQNASTFGNLTGNIAGGIPDYGSTYQGFDSSGDPLAGDVFGSTPVDYNVSISGAGSRAYLATNANEVGDTLTVTFRHEGSNGVTTLTRDIQVVPEPSAAILGSIGILALLRRRRL